MHEPTEDDVRKSKQALARMNDEITENLIQDSTILGNARRLDQLTVKALHLTELDHPAYPLLFALRETNASTKSAEEGEELRHKGIAGIFDRQMPIICAIFDGYLALRRERDELRARLEAPQ